MIKRLYGIARLFSMLAAIGLVSACSVIGAEGSPQQIAQMRAVHAFDENRAPYGQRIAAAEAIYTPRVYGLNPYFGR